MHMHESMQALGPIQAHEAWERGGLLQRAQLRGPSLYAAA